MRNKWASVLPITVLVVTVGLGVAMFWFSPANQAQLAYTMRDVELTPTKTYEELVQYFQIELDVTPNSEPQVFHLEEGEHTLIIRGREPETLLDKIQILSVQDATSTAAAWTPTPYPICTAVSCASGQYYCPSGDCLGGCGMVCAENTPTVTPTLPIDYEIVATNINVRVYYRGLGSDGKPKDLNERHTHSLYSFSDGYRLPHCDFMPVVDMQECSQQATFLLYVIRVTNGLPYDIGYWGAINEYTWIALYIEKSDAWYTDWRPE